MDFKKSAFFSHCAIWFVLIDAGRLGRAQRRPGGRGAPAAWQCLVLLSSYFKATITRLFDGFFEFFLNFYFSWIFAILSYLGLQITRARIKKVTSMNQDFLKNVWHIHLVHTSYLTHCGCKSRNLSKKIFNKSHIQKLL